MTEEVYNIYQDNDTRALIRFHICGTTFPDKTYQISRAEAKTYCIEYIEEGKGTVHLNDETFYPCAGDSYFLHAGKEHNYYSNKDDPWKKHFVNVSGKLVDSLAECYGISNIAYFKGLNLGKEIKKIIEIAQKGQEDHTSELIAILTEIFFKMYKHGKYTDDLSKLGMQMKDFLNAQITSKFNIELLCKHVSRSESQTIRIFKQLFGITPYQYVLSKKIGLAKKLLENTNLSINEISEKLCFSNTFSFSNAFKKRVGDSPQTYRKLATKWYKDN
ncbi:MAG: helix-turn-helix transcriptional regulator [Clostridia bacterium]|nr:helix-turn-helix transcriptional regulator [Clostridia bacterium]